MSAPPDRAASESDEVFAAERFERLRAERVLALGRPLTVRAVTQSTNDDAMLAARAGAAHGATFVADHQQRGRGRRDARWFAPPRASLLASVVVRPALAPEASSALSLAAGLAVRAAVATRLPAADVRLKWPNDVWVDGRKVAGILVEAQLRGGVLLGAVVGFGVNVALRRFPDDLRASATSLALAGAACRREELLADVLTGLARELERLESGGVAALHADLSRYDALFGKRVRVDHRRGVADGIDSRGRLRLVVDETSSIALEAGHVEIFRDA
jgi:BirA family biotin operon repressor/biotin-[acetyl-CoA-carboxylase] ligase